MGTISVKAVGIKHP
jgi:hypothetical protein